MSTKPPLICMYVGLCALCNRIYVWVRSNVDGDARRGPSPSRTRPQTGPGGSPRQVHTRTLPGLEVSATIGPLRRPARVRPGLSTARESAGTYSPKARTLVPRVMDEEGRESGSWGYLPPLLPPLPPLLPSSGVGPGGRSCGLFSVDIRLCLPSREGVRSGRSGGATPCRACLRVVSLLLLSDDPSRVI